MILNDAYILIEQYDSNLVDRFIHKYLNDFIEQSDYYEYPPYYGETEFESSDYKSMMNYIMGEKGRHYRFYFRNTIADSSIKMGMIFFNKDGSLVLGLNATMDKIDELKAEYGGAYFMICNEILPPDNAFDFAHAK